MLFLLCKRHALPTMHTSCSSYYAHVMLFLSMHTSCSSYNAHVMLGLLCTLSCSSFAHVMLLLCTHHALPTMHTSCSSYSHCHALPLHTSCSSYAHVLLQVLGFSASPTNGGTSVSMCAACVRVFRGCVSMCGACVLSVCGTPVSYV